MLAHQLPVDDALQLGRHRVESVLDVGERADELEVRPGGSLAVEDVRLEEKKCRLTMYFFFRCSLANEDVRLVSVMVE